MIKKLLRLSLLSALLLTLLLLWMQHDVKRGQAAYTKAHPLTVSPLHTGDFKLYTTGSDLYRALFQDIQQAKHRIYIHFFIIRHDAISKELLALLKKKGDEGVEVKLSVDLLGGFKLTRAALRDLQQHGVSFTYSRRTHLAQPFYSLHRRNHRRVIAIDGQISYIGGFNVGDEYLGKNKKLGKWRDYHARITGSGAGEAEQQFLRDWQEDTGEQLTAGPAAAKSGRTSHQYVYSAGAGLEQKMVSWLDGAARSITLATPYFVPPDSLMQALHRALDRGVHVRILVTKTTDAWFTQPPAYPLLLGLAKHGAEVYQYTDGFFHGKVLLIDDDFADIGTANWDQRSILLNDESNCLLYDKQVTALLAQRLEEDFRHAEKLTEAVGKQLPFWQRLMKDTPKFIQFYL